MGVGIELTSYYATDLLGVFLMGMLLLSRAWRIPTRRVESKLVLAMMLAALAGCILDALAWMADGQPGALNRAAVYATNTGLFLLNIVIGPCFVTLIARHIHEKLSPWRRKAINALCAAGVLLLIVNLFVPVVFSVDENNVYHREGFFWIFIAVEGVLMIYGLMIYVLARMRGRLLRFFPAWLFILPEALAMVIQSFLYGVSLLWTCTGISLCGMIVCLQKESVYLDKLTGVYNRFYLDDISELLRRRRRGQFAAMMLDMNGFKEINDRFSHAEGDAALIAVADILTDTVQSSGIVVRFAGDEFIVVLDQPYEGVIDEYRRRIFAGIDAYNASSCKPYRLAAAIGGQVFDAARDDITDFLSTIDHQMYEDKKNYYKTHDRRERRER
ncbi:MAG: GGDEF domain-containing protein [Ruminococcaceae bacterium]|nr:GGDEF domain-containing protein [Oscillospiraceae bacterium]